MFSRISAPLGAIALVVGLTACQSTPVGPPSVNGQWEQQGASHQACDNAPTPVDVELMIVQDDSDLTGTLALSDTTDLSLAFEGNIDGNGTIIGFGIYSDSTSSDIVAVGLQLVEGQLTGTVRGPSGCTDLFVIDVELGKV